MADLRVNSSGMDSASRRAWRRVMQSRLQIGPRRARGKAAEHEAAHATVAEALGYRVHEIVVGDHGSGHVEYEQASRHDTAVIAVAG